MSDISAEQRVRDMMTRAGVPDAQDYTASDLVEMANALCDSAHRDTVPRAKVDELCDTLDELDSFPNPDHDEKQYMDTLIRKAISQAARIGEMG